MTPASSPESAPAPAPSSDARPDPDSTQSSGQEPGLKGGFSGPMAAFTLPFLLYVIPTMIERKGWGGISYETICTLKGILSAGALWTFRRHYPSWSGRGLGLGIGTGVLGIFVWVLLDQLQTTVPIFRQLTSWLYEGARAGFDPFAERPVPLSTLAFVGVRLLELSIIVPLAEEIFWRGFLSRYVIAEDFTAIPHGTFTPVSLLIVTAAFASVHPELLAAVAWGLMINALYYHTKNLWACVVMHGVTNALLGAYVLATGNWHLW